MAIINSIDRDVARASGATTSVPRLKILLSAYACEPDKGSEAAVGWNWAKQAARYHDVWVITRSSNRTSIEGRTATDLSMANVRWVFYDLPHWLRTWKRQRRGLHLYYLIWQILAFRIAKRLHRQIQFDLVHHVTFANYWMPSLFGFLGVPFIWGPLGGAESGPRNFYSTLSVRGWLTENSRDFVRWCAERTPLQWAVARTADVAFAATADTAKALMRLGAKPVCLLSQVGLTADELDRLKAVPDHHEGPFRIVSIGNLIPLKGIHFGLAAFAQLLRTFPTSEYWVVGDGPERARLQRLASELGVLRNVRFVGAVPRDSVPNLLEDCDVLLHPSLHDSGGYVCAEAMAAGRPVICLDLGGPGGLVDSTCGIKVRAVCPEQTDTDLADALGMLAQDRALRLELGAGARRVVAARCDWDRKGELVYGEYAIRLARPQSHAA